MTAAQPITSSRARQSGVSGLWVFVCGPSGAGKDSVLGWAAQALAERDDVVFARRLITRAAHPGSDHDEVSPEQFARLIDGDGLAWHWQAHGFHYGIEARYAALVAVGRVVVNGSREHVNTLEAAEQLRVVQIEADAAQLAARLAQCRRDSAQEVAARLARNARWPTRAASWWITCWRRWSRCPANAACVANASPANRRDHTARNG